MIRTPMGPGFFIFFSREIEEEHSGSKEEYIPETSKISKASRIKKDDEEVMLLMQIILQRR